MFCIFAWCNKKSNDFESVIPFSIISESVCEYNPSDRITIVFLYGLEFLSEEYIDDLQRNKFKIINFETNFSSIVKEYHNIDTFFSEYERNCFLRWIVLDKLSAKSSFEQIWHFDGDIIFHDSLQAIAKDTKGKTFVLQGCPAFSSIAEPEWFAAYRKELRAFDRDICGYSSIANSHKAQFKENDRRLCNISLFRNPIGSDQDLFQYLISSQKIIQASSAQVFDSTLFFVQNPLIIGDWDNLQEDGSYHSIQLDAQGRLSVGNKHIPFVHYQNDFCNFAQTFLFLKNTCMQDHIPPYIRIRKEKMAISFQFKILRKILYNFGMKQLSRKQLIATLMADDKHNQESSLIKMLNFLKRRTSNLS